MRDEPLHAGDLPPGPLKYHGRSAKTRGRARDEASMERTPAAPHPGIVGCRIALTLTEATRTVSPSRGSHHAYASPLALFGARLSPPPLLRSPPAASPTTPPARPTRTATPRSSASPTSASSAATRTTARPATELQRRQVRRPSPATAAARPSAPPTRSASPTAAAPAPATRSARAAALREGRCGAKKPCKTENDCAQNEDCVNGFCTTEKAPAPPPTQCTLDAVLLRLQRVGADHRGDRDAGARRRLPEEGRPRRHAGRPHRPARHAGVQPGAVREARAVGARPPGPAGRRRRQAVGPAARVAGREGNRRAELGAGSPCRLHLA